MKGLNRVLRFALFSLAFISISLVIRRLLILLKVIPAVPRGSRFVMETGLKDYPLLTLFHIIPGLMVVVLGTYLLINKKINYAQQSHRLYVLLFIGAGMIVGVTAIIMPFITMPIGGLNEAVAAVVFGVMFVVTMIQVLIARLQNNPTVWREWMIRGVALSLAIASTRLIVIIAFVTAKVSAQAFLGTAFWMAFTIHLWMAECFVRYSSKKAQALST